MVLHVRIVYMLDHCCSIVVLGHGIVPNDLLPVHVGP